MAAPAHPHEPGILSDRVEFSRAHADPPDPIMVDVQEQAAGQLIRMRLPTLSSGG